MTALICHGGAVCIRTKGTAVYTQQFHGAHKWKHLQDLTMGATYLVLKCLTLYKGFGNGS